MKYAVQWQPEAEESPAALWLVAKDRKGFTKAANEIDRILEEDAHTQGESRSDEDRILFVPPLEVLFRVFLTDRVVMVTRLGWSGKPQ